MPATEQATDVDELAASPPRPEGPEGDDAGVVPERRGLWLSWLQLAALGVALAFLGGAVVYYAGSRDRSPGEVDVGFVQDMTTHHDQAVEMALIELDRGENPTVLGFAKDILIFQNRELGIMATRLDDWGSDPADRPATAMGWMDMETAPGEMPGMATEAEMDALAGAEGAAADALFLELVTEHHRGGIHMAGYAATHAGDDEVRELAGRMARWQAIEINEMAQTAERLGFDVDIEPAEVPPEPGN
jgi:uncharacterized protein (DUF305 family)